jgi:hypothetical protein
MVSTRLRWFCAVSALTCVFASWNVAWGADKCGSLDRVIVAIRLARTLYPEVKGREFSLQFSEGTGGPPSSPADVRSFLIALDKPHWHPPGNDGAHSDAGTESASAQGGDIDLPLYLHFEFVQPATVEAKYLVSCRPHQFRNETESKQMKEARADINSDPEWSDTKELDAAKQFGLRFGPENKTALLRLIPLKELSTFYGPLRIKNVRFQIHGTGEKCAGCSFADLHWYIDAEEVGTPRALQITVEPFDGRIDGISEERERL